jgi:hypothetical protein
MDHSPVAPEAVHRSRLAAACKSVGVVTLVLLGAVLLTEATLRVFTAYRPPDYPPAPARPDLFTGDTIVGYHLWPQTRTCMRYPGNTHRMLSLISNSDGFASSRELGEPDPRPRVLVIGDSFTMGLGVNEGTRYTEIVEDLEPRWRVDNMGMIGWGLDLMVRALEAHGKKARPNAVVFAVYTESLARLSPRWIGQAPVPFRKYELVDGKLVDLPPYRPGFLYRFHLTELLRTVQERVGGSRFRNRYPLNEALLNKFFDLTRELNAAPVVLFLPGTQDTPQGRERRAFLRGWTEARGVTYLDLTDVIYAAGVDTTYIRNNFHWSEYGHQVAGRALHELLSTRVMQGQGSEVDVRSLAPAPWRQRPDYCADRAGEDSGKAPLHAMR